MKNIYRNLLLFTLIIFASCKKIISVNAPKTQLTAENVFKDDGSATSAIVEIYANLNINFTAYLDMLTDESADIGYYVAGTDYDAYKNDALSPNDYFVSNGFWTPCYQSIYMCNAALKGLQSPGNVSAATRAQLQGEAKFLRAYCYFNLVNLFGSVPLITSTDVRVTAEAPRTDVSEIVQQIISDLQDAQQLLTEDYVTGEKVRANKSAATALLARTYLYSGKWIDAEAQASDVINSGLFSFPSDISTVFRQNSSEAILQFWTQDGFTFTGENTIHGFGTPGHVFYDQAIADFEPGDLRKLNWTDSLSYNGKVYFFPFKYRQLGPVTGDAEEYNMILRLGEQYLIRAEARAHQNNVSGAIDDLNMLRSRAGLSVTQANDSSSLLTAIASERKTELFWECGHRWFDLKRTGQINTVLGAFKPGFWKTTSALYPLPQQEITINSNLTQNPGY